VASPAPTYFSTLSHERHDFREKVVENEMSVLIFPAPFILSLSVSKTNIASYYRKFT
jgi:hypothetical protein